MDEDWNVLLWAVFMSLDDIIDRCWDDGAVVVWLELDIIRLLLSDIPFIMELLFEAGRMLGFEEFLFCDFLTVSRTGPQAGQAESLHLR